MKQRQGETSCKCQLQRKVQIECVQVFGRLVIDQKRPDVQKILKMHLEGEVLPERLNEFLKRINLLKGTQLTDKGREVLRTSTLPTEERGLYYVWYTANDLLFHTRPLFIQRETSYFEPNIKRYQPLQAGSSKYAVDESCVVQIWNEDISKNGLAEDLTIRSFRPEKIGESRSRGTLSLHWNLAAQKSNIQLQGNLKIGSRSKKGGFKQGAKEHHLSLHLNEGEKHWKSIMKSVAETVSGDWNPDHQRIQIGLDQIEESRRDQTIENFSWSDWKKNVETDIGDFTINMSNIPFMPYKQDVEDWQKAWVQQYYQATYHIASSARKAQAEWLSHPALQTFSLEMWSVDEMLQRTRNHRRSFWHIATMQDLIPDQIAIKRTTWALTAGEKLSKRQFWERLSCEQEITGLLISDRYASNYQEQLEDLLSYCSSDVDVHILSTEKPSKSWTWHEISKTPETHSRHWIIKTKKQEYCWVVDNSLSFVDFRGTSEEIKVKGGTYWTPIKHKDLPSYLKELQSGESI